MVSWDTRMLSFLGYRIFNHPEICSGDQSRISLLATIVRSFPWMARRHALGRRADSRPDDRLHWLDTVDARRDAPPPGSPSTQLAAPWLSPESTNRKQFLVRCLPARPAASADEQPELSRRAAT